MLFRFPPQTPAVSDPSFLASEKETFAKLKIESKAGKRTVFLTEHTLIFVIRGIKLLHFANHTLRITPDSIFLLRKGIYVMAEYIEEGLNFEALMIFLPEPVLKSFITKSDQKVNDKHSSPCVVFPASKLMQDYKIQFRQYFEHPLFDYTQLLPLKQKEILTLLLSSGNDKEMQDFIHTAVSRDPRDMSTIVEEHILQPITVTELARLCNRSLAAFKRDFTKHYHSSPRTYINQQRLNHARMLLQNTDKLIAEVANACAFENTSYFSRVFKREFGKTPNEIRAVRTIE